MDVKGEKELLQTAVVWVLQLPHFHFQQHTCLMNAIHFQINYEWQVFEPIKRAPYFICSKFNSRLCFTSAVWHVYCCWKMKAPGVRDKRQQFYWAPAKWRFDRLVAEPVKWNARSNFTQKGSDVLSCPQTLNTNWINDSGSTSWQGRWCAIHNSLLEGLSKGTGDW